MPIVTQETGLFEGLVLSELLARASDRLKQKRGNYDRYSRQSIIDAINDGQIEAAKKLRCLHGFSIIVLKEDYSQYKCPSSYLLPKKAFFYQSSTSYYELGIKTRDWLDTFKPGWRTTDGDPLVMFPGDNYGNMRKLGFYPRPDTDGTAYVSGDDSGVVVSDSTHSTTGNITGQNGTASATVCTDSSALDMAARGVQVGMIAVNATTGESGQISAVSGATFTTSAADFTSGWSIGDSYNVLAGEYGTIVKWDGDEQYLYSSDYGGTLDVRNLTNNVYLEYYRRPFKLVYDEQYPEIPPDLHQYLPDYAPFILKRNAPKGSTDYAEAVLAKNAFDAGIGTYINLEQKTQDVCVRFRI